MFICFTVVVPNLNCGIAVVFLIILFYDVHKIEKT